MFPLKLPFPLGRDLGPHLLHVSLSNRTAQIIAQTSASLQLCISDMLTYVNLPTFTMTVCSGLDGCHCHSFSAISSLQYSQLQLNKAIARNL